MSAAQNRAAANRAKKAAAPRLRLLGMVIQVQVVVDDGDTLRPLSINPIAVPAEDVPRLTERFAESWEALLLEFANQRKPAPADDGKP